MVFRKILASKSHHSRHHHHNHHNYNFNFKWQKHRHTLISNVTGTHETKYLSPLRNSSNTNKTTRGRKRDKLHVKIKLLRDKIHRQIHPTCVIDDMVTVTSDEKYGTHEYFEKDELATLSLEELFPKANRCQNLEENEEETNSVIHRQLGRIENENDFPQWGSAKRHYNFETDQYYHDQIIGRMKSEIRNTKLNSVKTTNKTLDKAIEAQRTGKRVLQQLNCQSNQLTKIEENCDMLKIQSNVADRKIDELVHENRSLFALKSPNPFRKKREREKQNQIDQLKLKQYHLQQETMACAQESRKNLAVNLNSNYERYDQELERQHILRNAQKYQFEPDEEDNRMEIDLYGNLEQIKAASSNLKVMAQAFGREFEAHNSRMFDIENDVQQVDGALQAKMYRLDRIAGRKG